MNGHEYIILTSTPEPGVELNFDHEALIDHVDENLDKYVIEEATHWPETMTCSECGGVLDFISIELGYSCKNPECVCHLQEATA